MCSVLFGAFRQTELYLTSSVRLVTTLYPFYFLQSQNNSELFLTKCQENFPWQYLISQGTWQHLECGWVWETKLILIFFLSRSYFSRNSTLRLMSFFSPNTTFLVFIFIIVCSILNYTLHLIPIISKILIMSRFSKKATNFETISHLIWRLLRKCQIKWVIVSNFCGLFRMSEL